MIRLRARVVMAVAVLVAVIVQFPIGRIGDLGPIDGRRAASHSGMAFDQDSWASGDRAARGRMLADLARRYRFVKGQAEAVIRLLGPANCAIRDGDDPCYELELDGRRYDLQFGLKDAGNVGEVVSMDLVER